MITQNYLSSLNYQIGTKEEYETIQLTNQLTDIRLYFITTTIPNKTLFKITDNNISDIKQTKSKVNLTFEGLKATYTAYPGEKLTIPGCGKQCHIDSSFKCTQSCSWYKQNNIPISPLAPSNTTHYNKYTTTEVKDDYPGIAITGDNQLPLKSLVVLADRMLYIKATSTRYDISVNVTHDIDNGLNMMRCTFEIGNLEALTGTSELIDLKLDFYDDESYQSLVGEATTKLQITYQ